MTAEEIVSPIISIIADVNVSIEDKRNYIYAAMFNYAKIKSREAAESAWGEALTWCPDCIDMEAINKQKNQYLKENFD